MEREKFSSRLGFILISAGCAIGLGNVWRFPYITGKYGGAAFVILYLFFLVILGLPIMVMEFSVGRASRKSAALSFDVLEPKGTKWHLYKYGAMAGNYLLMMFYTTIGGWMVLYFFKTALGQFDGLTSAEVSESFGTLMSQPGLMTFFMILTVVICFGICSLGLQKGVEKITKVMMVCLLGLMIVLAVRSLLLKGGEDGIKFYLFPDFKKLTEGSGGLWEAVYAAMGQSFFTLSLGIGALAIFGSYIGKERSLTGEALSIAVPGYLRSPDGRTYHFPGLLRLRHPAGQRSQPDLYHPAQRIQHHERRSALGKSLLPLHVLRRFFHDHRGV